MDEPSLCTYCNASATTREHVPPKLFWPKPRPDGLITVPACQACNASFQQDDDYARMWIVSSVGLERHAEGRKSIESVFRNFRRANAAGLKASFVKTFLGAQQGPRETGHPLVVDIERHRVSRVIARSAIGLHRFRYGMRVVPEFGAHAVPTHDLESIADPNETESLCLSSLRQLAERAPFEEIGNSCVQVKCGRSRDEPRLSV